MFHSIWNFCLCVLKRQILILCNVCFGVSGVMWAAISWYLFGWSLFALCDPRQNITELHCKQFLTRVQFVNCLYGVLWPSMAVVVSQIVGGLLMRPLTAPKGHTSSSARVGTSTGSSVFSRYVFLWQVWKKLQLYPKIAALLSSVVSQSSKETSAPFIVAFVLAEVKHQWSKSLAGAPCADFRLGRWWSIVFDEVRGPIQIHP